MLHSLSSRPDPAARLALKLSGNASDRRRHDRRWGPFPSELLACDVGAVLDISTSGIRLMIQGRLKDDYQIVLQHGVRSARLNGRVRWSRRIGLIRHEAGLEFANVTREDADMLSAVVGV